MKMLDVFNNAVFIQLRVVKCFTKLRVSNITHIQTFRYILCKGNNVFAKNEFQNQVKSLPQKSGILKGDSVAQSIITISLFINVSSKTALRT